MSRLLKLFYHVFLAICGISALLSGARMFYYFFFVLLAIRILSYLSIKHYQDNLFLRCAVDKEVITSGEQLKITYRLTNASLLPLWHGNLSLKLPKEMLAKSFIHHGVFMGPQETIPFVTEVICPFRGYYALGDAEMNASDPMGFYERPIDFNHVVAVTVYPQIIHLPPLLFQPRAEGGSLKAPHRAFDDRTHLMNLRDYVRGDDLKSIHWKLSAKRDQLVVREFHKSVSERLTVFMDGFYGNWGGAFDAEAEERMVSFCASYLMGAAERGLDYALYLNNMTLASFRGDRSAAVQETLALLTAFRSDGAEAFELYLAKQLEHAQVYEHVVFIVPRLSVALVQYLSTLPLTYDVFALRLDSEIQDFPHAMAIGPLMGGATRESA